MIPDKVLYTDGHHVTVTETMLKVNSTLYRLNGITKHGLSVSKPNKFPAFFVILLGIIIGMAGLFQVIPSTSIPDVQVGGKVISANIIALLFGGLFLVTGIVILAVEREKYSVRIATAEGEKDVIVSNKKEYISQIINALNEAFNFANVNSTSYTVLK